jgi:hypothetical protein
MTQGAKKIRNKVNHVEKFMIIGTICIILTLKNQLRSYKAHFESRLN